MRETLVFRLAAYSLRLFFSRESMSLKNRSENPTAHQQADTDEVGFPDMASSSQTVPPSEPDVNYAQIMEAFAALQGG